MLNGIGLEVSQLLDFFYRGLVIFENQRTQLGEIYNSSPLKVSLHSYILAEILVWCSSLISVLRGWSTFPVNQSEQIVFEGFHFVLFSYCRNESNISRLKIKGRHPILLSY